ncbi:MAG: VWA domain-containing protein, partial [Candidatus Aenigmatarchaeota archaeon]
MQLVFTDKYLNLLLLLSGFVVLVFFYSKRKKKDRALKFGNYETLKKVAGRNFLKTSNLLVLTRVLAISALIIGISNPALVQEVRSPESDFVVALDSSASMFTSDIDPTRFKAAKQVSKSFVSKNPGNVEIGFVAFSGNVEKVVELTNKHGKVLSAIDSTGMGETGGTNIAEAISTSVSLLLGEQNKGKVILITDGENTAESSLNRSLDFAETHNISIYTIGIGSRNGSA